MKKSSFLALALAPMILGTPMALAESVSTDPVGFVKIDLEPGLQTVGLPMLNPSVAAGLVASSDASSLTMASDLPALDAGAFYVEVASGEGDAPWVGERFDVASVSGAVVTINTASSANTVSLGGVDLAGYSVRVRPHVTLADAFSPTSMTPGDQVLIFNATSGGFDTYTLTADIFGGAPSWQRAGVNQDGLPIPSGLGVFYRNSSNAASSVVALGEVRTNNFRQPLGAGLNLVSEGHPLDNSSSSRVMTGDNGFEVGDAILVFNSGSGGFDTYTFTADIFGGASSWQRGGVNHDNTSLFLADGSVFIRKGSADPLYEAPKTF